MNLHVCSSILLLTWGNKYKNSYQTMLRADLQKEKLTCSLLFEVCPLVLTWPANLQCWGESFLLIINKNMNSSCGLFLLHVFKDTDCEIEKRTLVKEVPAVKIKLYNIKSNLEIQNTIPTTTQDTSTFLKKVLSYPEGQFSLLVATSTLLCSCLAPFFVMLRL